MRTKFLKPSTGFGIGLLLALPTAYFFLIPQMNFQLGLPTLYENATPIFSHVISVMTW